MDGWSRWGKGELDGVVGVGDAYGSRGTGIGGLMRGESGGRGKWGSGREGLI